MSGRTTLGDVTLRYTVDPARAGLNQLNLYLFDERGRPFRGTKTIRAELSPRRPARPRLPLEAVGPGHYVDSATQFDQAAAGASS